MHTLSYTAPPALEGQRQRVCAQFSRGRPKKKGAEDARDDRTIARLDSVGAGLDEHQSTYGPGATGEEKVEKHRKRMRESAGSI